MTPGGDSSPPSRGLWVAALGALALACLAVHASTLQNGFIDFDDRALVDFAARHSFADYFREPHFFNYAPVTLASLGLEARLVGARPLLYHVDNILLHTLVALLTAVVLRGLRQPAWISLGIAALFALHPMRVESVAWIAERKALLAGVFSLGALLCWIRFARARARGAYAGAFTLLALALLAKPTAVPLPLLFLAIDWHRGRGLGSRVWVEKLPFLALSIAAGLVNLAAQRSDGPSLNAAQTWLERVAGAGEALVFYVSRSLVPIGLSGYYELGVSGITSLDAVVAGAAATGIIAWLVRHPEHRRDALLGLAWFGLLVAPTLRVVAFGGLSVYSDRYIYQACVGLWLLLTLPLRGLETAPLTTRRLAAVGVAAWIGALALASAARGPVWKDAERFWSEVAAAVPGSSLAHLQLGGQRAAGGEHERALDHYRIAVEAKPICGPCFIGMAASHEAMGNHAGVREALERAVAASPQNLPTLIAAARFHLRSGRTGVAIPLLEAASELEPRPAQAHMALGHAYLRLDRSDEARARFESVLAADPQHAGAALALGSLALAQGRSEQARSLIARARANGAAVDPAILRRVGLSSEEP